MQQLESKVKASVHVVHARRFVSTEMRMRLLIHSSERRTKRENETFETAHYVASVEC